MAKQNSNKTESNTKSSLQQRFLRTNSKTAQRPGFAISKRHLKTKHTQIRAQARKQQNTQYIWKLLYWEQGQTQHKTNTQAAHEQTEWQLWKKQNAIQGCQTVECNSTSQSWACFLSLARSKLRLCSANHRAGYFSNLACDWLSIVWAYPS